MLAVGGDKDDRRRIFELAQGVGQLDAGGARHVDVQEHHIGTLVLEALDGLSDVGGLGYDLDLARLIQQKPKLRTCRSFIVADNSIQHRAILPFLNTLLCTISRDLLRLHISIVKC